MGASRLPRADRWSIITSRVTCGLGQVPRRCRLGPERWKRGEVAETRGGVEGRVADMGWPPLVLKMAEPDAGGDSQ